MGREMPQPNDWQRMRRQRLSRRALLRASARAGIGAAGLALVGCADDDDDTQQPAAAAPPQQQPPEQSTRQQPQPPAPTVRQAEQRVAQTEQQIAPADPEEVLPPELVEPYPEHGGNYSVNAPPGWDHIDPHRANLRLPFIVFSDSLGRLIQIDDNYCELLRRPVWSRGVWNRSVPTPFTTWASDIAFPPEMPDAETHIFYFGEGARFWDRYPTEGGRLFTAEDAAVNINRQIEAVDANGEPDALFSRSGLYRQTVSVEILDELTLVLQTEDFNAAYLESVHMGYSFLTSLEAIELWDLDWLDERANIELISGTGPFIPTELDENLRVQLVRNRDYWKSHDYDGQQMPFFDSITWHVFSDPAAVEAAYRNGVLDHVTWGALSTTQVDGIHEDFPDHIRYDRGELQPIGMRFNYNADWAENPWLDRRVPYAFHLAMDRDAIIDFVFLGKGKPSPIQRLNWYHRWAIPDDKMRQLPGYRPNKTQDIADARALLDAAGIDPEAEFPLVNAREFEAAHRGSSELYADMFSDALGIPVKIILEPYDSISQQLAEGKFPGHAPIWLPSGTDNPTSAWNNELVFGAGGNHERYNFAPVEELVKRMQATIYVEEAYELTDEVSRILLGEDERYGLDGFAPTSIVGNGLESSIYRPYLNLPERAKSTWGNEGYHWNKEAWFTQHHPDLPARA